MTITRTQALIVGGGPSGLAVAYALQGDTLVLEKEDRVGGLCRSVYHQGGVFDIGGHSFHTPHPEVYELVQDLLGGELVSIQRDARVYTHGTLIPYPFQRYFDRIPDPEVVRACEQGLLNANGHAALAENFEQYIRLKFGDGIAEHFMLPYNRKLWARDISKISCEWIPERVAAPKGEQEKFDTQSGKRKPLQPDTRVGYPPRGGYEEIYRLLASRTPAVALNAQVVRIDPVHRIAETRDGHRYQYEFLVSTMPLPLLARVVDGVPLSLVELADRLEYMSLRVEFLLTRRPLESTLQRIYVADPAIPPHKIALNHNSSPHLKAQPHHAIMAEVSLSAEKQVPVEEIAPRTIDFLCELGILSSPEEILWQGHMDVKYAYPVYTHRRPEQVRAIRQWMEALDIYTVGRFGDWEYINSDKCVHKGLALGRELRRRYPLPAASARERPAAPGADR